jgi:hypothetical protein
MQHVFLERRNVSQCFGGEKTEEKSYLEDPDVDGDLKNKTGKCGLHQSCLGWGQADVV